VEIAMKSSSPLVRLPSRDVDAVLFDLDGVVTQTVKLHVAAWKELFDGYLHRRAGLEHKSFQPFDAADDIHYPGTYLVGGYNRLVTEIAGRVIESEDLVNLPNWLCLTFQPEDGNWLDLRAVKILSYQQALHLSTECSPASCAAAINRGEKPPS
jgi:hypothetical protein